MNGSKNLRRVEPEDKDRATFLRRGGAEGGFIKEAAEWATAAAAMMIISRN